MSLRPHGRDSYPRPADHALEATPDNGTVQEAVASVYERRAAEENLLSRNRYSSAVEYARDGRPFR